MAFDGDSSSHASKEKASSKDLDTPAGLDVEEPTESRRVGSKIEIGEHENYDKPGFSFPEWKKWVILTIISLVQVSMNFNTSV